MPESTESDGLALLERMKLPGVVRGGMPDDGTPGNTENGGQDWRSQYTADPELGPIVKNITEPDIPSVIKSYHGLKGQLGKAVFLKDPANQEEVKKAQARAYEMGIFKKPNVPESPDKYEMTRPDVIPEHMWSNDIANEFRQLAHRHNISQDAVKDLLSLEAKRFGSFGTALAERKQQADGADARWAKENGMTLEQVDDFVVDYLTRHFQEQGAGADTAEQQVKQMVDSGLFHLPGVRQLLAKAGRDTGEDVSLHTETGGDGADASPQFAEAQKIMRDPKHPDHAKYLANDPAIVAKVDEAYRKRFGIREIA